MLEAGIVGGNSVACPAHYVGINGRVAGPVSCTAWWRTTAASTWRGTANRLGASVLLGHSCWLVRPALRQGIEYDNGEVSETIGTSFTFGRRYGARSIVHFGGFSRDPSIVLFQMGGYVSLPQDKGGARRPQR